MAQKADTIYQYLNRLAASKDQNDSITLDNKLQVLASSSRERDIMIAINMYSRTKRGRLADSLNKATLLKFPAGILARSAAQGVIFNSKDPVEAEKLYRQWVAKFPPSRFPNEDHDHIIYDYARSHIAQLYAGKKNVAKAELYASMLEEEFWKGNGYAGLSAEFRKGGDLPHAEVYAKKAMESAKSFLNATDNAGKFAAFGYVGLCDTYADILYEEKKYDKGLEVIDGVYKSNKEVDPRTNYVYAKLLMAEHRDREAYVRMDELMRTGKAEPAVRKEFKELYIKVKGSDAGYDEYMASIRKAVMANLQQKLAREIMDKPAPLFTLTDLDGRQVTLEQYRGKTVVLDFWATWCGPCKRSFPAMKMAQDKYKNDTDVKFLFIHTWEKSDRAPAEARAYIQDHHFDFEVLMDLKDRETKENKVVSSYGVNGIPAKFIIDPKGNIRFQLTGFGGTDEEAVDELSMMIEMIKKA
jgi:thiol-disulfide isomerase/thioredoxin